MFGIDMAQKPLPPENNMGDAILTQANLSMQDALAMNAARAASAPGRPKLSLPIIGMDKIAHATVSALVVAGGWFALKGLLGGPAALLVAVLGSFLLGYGKEYFDYRRGKEFSREDLAADLVGAIAAAVVVTAGSVAP